MIRPERRIAIECWTTANERARAAYYRHLSGVEDRPRYVCLARGCSVVHESLTGYCKAHRMRRIA